MMLAATGRVLGAAGLLLAMLAAVAAADDGPARLIGPFTRDDYPQAVIDRPLTLPAGMVEGELAGRFVSRSFPPLAYSSLTAGVDDWFLDLAVRVGVTDRVQLEAGTAFSLDHQPRGAFDYFQGAYGFDPRPSLTSWQRVIPFRASVLALDTETLDTAVRLTLPFVAYEERRVRLPRQGFVTLRNSTGRALEEVRLDAPTRWRITDWLWFRAGEDLFAVSTFNGFAAFSFPLGIGVQAHRMLAFTLDSRIAAVAFDGSGHSSSVTLADYGTLLLEGTFTPIRCLDIFGDLDLPNLRNGVDVYAIRTGVRVRF